MKIYKEQTDFTTKELEAVESWLIGELRQAYRDGMGSTHTKQLERQLDGARSMMVEMKERKEGGDEFKTKKQIWIDGLGKKERSCLLNDDGGIHGISDPNSKIVVEVKNGYMSVWGTDKKHPLIASVQVELGAMDRVFDALKIAIEDEAL